MKNTLSFVALATSLGQVSATGLGFGFSNAPKFTCPDNTDNVCIPDIVKGIDWSDLNIGGFESYKGFKWSGFTCADKFSKRDELAPRTFQNKCITGKATKDKTQSPKISCDKSQGVSKTSIKKFQVTPEFDCDLEFHYTMPDGSSCKHRSSCKASGTTVENTQCGGATDVTIVYPEQPKLPKSTCDFGIHQIDFDCEDAQPTTSYIASTSTYAVSTPSLPATISSAISSSSAVVSSSSAVVSSSSAVVSSSSAVISSTSAVETTSSAYEVSSSAASSISSSEVLSSFSVTSYLTTSTVFTTSVQTITSCGATVTNCPARSTVLTTVTVPISTTICPVTETISVSSTQAVSTPGSYPAESTSLPIGSSTSEVKPTGSTSLPIASSTQVVSTPGGYPTESASTLIGSSSSENKPTTSLPIGSSTSSPAGPVETLPCPDVVPSCLNTWMFSVGCKDNTDSSCYCPDASFVSNVFTCLYAHGESDEVISEAINYFQGICAPINPGVFTGAESITTILTATATAPPAAVTTIEVATTVVVPCTNEAGETIPSSSSTITINTSYTVPAVVFTTLTSGPSSTGVVVVPGTYVATVPVAVPTLATPTATATPVAPYPTITGSTTLFTAPGSTGLVYPTASISSTSPIPTAGAAHIGAGMGALGFAGMVVAALI
ncbi:uncharacterized protein GGS25DRAFT_524491 [Hypoxylon fragiforme]|uniref:uncharacterized protein n=1 Tax=Hypoxylon fragiforme TaxID=63214 RepID=UPI0020C64AA2|nr:uncharacterized protein GGS25DRAFT_524491 [Hypoxylon fragiforme]KAI2604993.1 hypothetical protein GGS25DRAFT_524491 [Hypoxylon fragiforme]